MPLAWLLSVLAALSLPLWAGVLAGGAGDAFDGPALKALPALLWPPALGLVLSLLLGWTLRRAAPWLSRRLPAGDLWWPLAAGARRLRRPGRATLRWLAAVQASWVAWWVAREHDAVTGLDVLTRAEGWLRRQLALLLLAVALGLAAVLLVGVEGMRLWP
jgi:hydrogenase-4 component B